MAAMTTIIKNRLAAKEEELRRVQAELTLLRSMLAEANGEPSPDQGRAPTRARRSSVKTYVLELLERAGRNGLNAALAVEMAEADGKTLERGTVSSLLSRMKTDGAITYDGDRYRLTKFAEPASSAAILSHPASSRTA